MSNTDTRNCAAQRRFSVRSIVSGTRSRSNSQETPASLASRCLACCRLPPAGEPGVTQVQVGHVLHLGQLVLPDLAHLGGHLFALTLTGSLLAAEGDSLGEPSVRLHRDQAADDLGPGLVQHV